MRNRRVSKRKTKYNAIPSIISHRIYEADYLSSGAKLFWGMLNFLSRPEDLIYDDHKAVYASNFYFYTQMGRSSKYSARAIQGYISELKEHDHVEVWFEKGIRYILPKSVTRFDSHVAAFIPPEVVKDINLSASRKLTYGYINWKSANVNGYYNTTVEEIAEEANRHRSTIYRHINDFEKLRLITVGRDGRTLDIYCHNSYQESYEASQKKKDEEHLKRQQLIEDEYLNKSPPESSISPEATDYLRKLIGK